MKSHQNTAVTVSIVLQIKQNKFIPHFTLWTPHRALTRTSGHTQFCILKLNVLFSYFALCCSPPQHYFLRGSLNM